MTWHPSFVRKCLLGTLPCGGVRRRNVLLVIAGKRYRFGGTPTRTRRCRRTRTRILRMVLYRESSRVSVVWRLVRRTRWFTRNPFWRVILRTCLVTLLSVTRIVSRFVARTLPRTSRTIGSLRFRLLGRIVLRLSRFMIVLIILKVIRVRLMPMETRSTSFRVSITVSRMSRCRFRPRMVPRGRGGVWRLTRSILGRLVVTRLSRVMGLSRARVGMVTSRLVVFTRNGRGSPGTIKETSRSSTGYSARTG